MICSCQGGSCGSGMERGNAAYILLALRVPRIVSRLHAYPDPGAIAKQLAKSDRHGRRDRLALAQNVVEMLPRNAEKVRNLGLSFAGRRNHILPQQSARMGRTAISIALGDMSHDCLSSVILFEIDSASVAVRELKRDAPWAIHMD